MSSRYLADLFDHLVESLVETQRLLAVRQDSTDLQVRLSTRALDLSVLRRTWRLRDEVLGVCGVPPHGESPLASDAALERAGFTLTFITELTELGPELEAFIVELERAS